ncbi:MAG: hypothetical protein J6R77_03495, partial [Clostridia bacterium]|nr:hypothetical protein [Clostridia bacterium]
MRMQLYYAYMSESEYPYWDARVEELPPIRRERVAACRLAGDRARSVAVTALLRYALSDFEKGAGFGNEGVCFCDVPSDALCAPYPRWESDENGRPFPTGIDTPAGRVWVSPS